MSATPDESQSHSPVPSDPAPGDSPVVMAHLIAEALREVAANAHDCRYDIIGLTYPRGPERPRHPRLGPAPEVTRVLLRCQVCGVLEVHDLEGNWSPAQLFGEPLTPEPPDKM